MTGLSSHPTRGSRRTAALAAVLSGLLLLPAAAPAVALAADGGGLKAVIEMHSTLLSEGDPIEVRFSLWNDGSNAVENLPKGPLARKFHLVDADGSEIEPNRSAAADAPSPPSLPPGGHYGIAFDLGSLYPKMRETGTYRLYWESDGLESNQVVLKIVPRYDPAKDYIATLRTNHGDIKLSFFKQEAPLAVRNFIELANQGFYDGTDFHRVESDRMIVGGDRGGSGSGIPGYTIPYEPTNLQMLAGTVGFKKAGMPPTNGSVFFVLAGPRPELRGQFTAFAQVVEGLEIVRKISRVKHSGPRSATPNRPLERVVITRVDVSEKPSG